MPPIAWDDWLNLWPIYVFLAINGAHLVLILTAVLILKWRERK
jgi:hypothetical protein